MDCFRSGVGLAGGFVRHAELLFWGCWLVGFAAIAAGWRDARYALLGAISLGSLLSGPFIFQDGAPRVFAATIAADATQMGLGVALLPDYLAKDEIQAGRLLPLLKPSLTGTGTYWLAWPQSRASYPPLVSFRSWLAKIVDESPWGIAD